jgi:hypothetical protein
MLERTSTTKDAFTDQARRLSPAVVLKRFRGGLTVSESDEQVITT